jgi:hypothetical protein
MRKSELRKMIKEEIKVLNEKEKPADFKKVKKKILATFSEIKTFLSGSNLPQSDKNELLRDAKREEALAHRATNDEALIGPLAYFEVLRAYVAGFEADEADPRKIKKLRNSLRVVTRLGKKGRGYNDI